MMCSPCSSKSLQSVAFLDSSFQVSEIKEKMSGKSVPAALKSLHKVARLCNGAKFTADDASLPMEERSIKGDSTDTAILRFAESLSVPDLSIDSATLVASHERLLEIPFNSRNKWMLTVVRERDATKSTEPWMLVKGAPDVLFPSCTSVMNADGSIVRLDSATHSRLSSLQSEWSSAGQRVLVLCQRSLDGVKIDPQRMSSNEIEELMYEELQGLTLVGLIGIRDPPRYDVADALKIIRRAGVKVFMVTGDFKLTAVAIAKQVRHCYLICWQRLTVFIAGWNCYSREGRHA